MTHQPVADSPMGDRPYQWVALVGWILLAALAGAVGGLASINSREYYAGLAQPEWAPPGWVFGPVWTTLYVLMAIAAWLVWRTQVTAGSGAARARRNGLWLFVAQLVLNALWTWLFFAWHKGALAFIEILVLWLAIALTSWQFARVRVVAGWLLVPYIAWVGFAAALTWAVWQANPARL